MSLKFQLDRAIGYSFFPVMRLAGCSPSSIGLNIHNIGTYILQPNISIKTHRKQPQPLLNSRYTAPASNIYNMMSCCIVERQLLPDKANGGGYLSIQYPIHRRFVIFSSRKNQTVRQRPVLHQLGGRGWWSAYTYQLDPSHQYIDRSVSLMLRNPQFGTTITLEGRSSFPI